MSENLSSLRKNSRMSVTECMMCGKLFTDGAAGESWIACQLCKGWCHKDCTDGGTSAGFTCDFCR